MGEPRPVSERGHTRGRSSSWAVVAVITMATIAGGVALIFHIWPLVYAMAGVFVLGVIGGRVVGIMDDTVAWTAPLVTHHRMPEGPQSRRAAFDGAAEAAHEGSGTAGEARDGERPAMAAPPEAVREEAPGSGGQGGQRSD